MPISAANISLRQLTAFVAVVDHGGFAAAAGALHMTQSAVSQAIQSLEQALGGSLVLRDRRQGIHRRLELTALGDAALEHARAVLGRVDDLIADATAESETPACTVRVGSIRSVAVQVLAPACRTLRRRYPRLTIDVWEGTDREVHQWMIESRVHMGLVGPLLAAIPDALVIPLMTDPWYVALPAAHPLAQRSQLDLYTVSREPYIMSDGGCEPVVRALFDTACATPNVTHRAQSAQTVLAMVAGGFGLTLVPELGVQTFAMPAIRTVRLAPAVSRTVSAVVMNADAAPAAANLVVAALQQRVARSSSEPSTTSNRRQPAPAR